VTKHGGLTVCSLIAPYRDARRAVRAMVEESGVFVEVFVDTSLEECERRDTKGLYAKARQGLITGFTGIDDPYEVPERPEIIAKTEESTPEEIVDMIVTVLKEKGVLCELQLRPEVQKELEEAYD